MKLDTYPWEDTNVIEKQTKQGITRRTILKGVAAGTAVGVVGAPFIARGQTATTLRVAHIESTDSATHKGYEAFATKIAEATNGAVEVKIFPAGQLGGLRDLYEGLKPGSVDITSSGPDYTANIEVFRTGPDSRSSSHAAALGIRSLQLNPPGHDPHAVFLRPSSISTAGDASAQDRPDNHVQNIALIIVALRTEEWRGLSWPDDGTEKPGHSRP